MDRQLAMTRAFGDEKVKDHITSELDIFIENIDKGTEFILLASDGLWKVLTPLDALDIRRHSILVQARRKEKGTIHLLLSTLKY